MKKNQSMDPRVKKLLVGALRSGDYEQDKLYLKTEQGYCCLGVACTLYKNELSKEEDWEAAGKIYDQATGKYKTNYSIFGEYNILPTEVAEWMGLTYSSAISLVGSYLTKDYNPFSLAELNDSGASFEEIADVIEEYF